MDRFLKRLAPSGSNSSPSSSPLAKKPKVSDKQGNVSASFRAKELVASGSYLLDLLGMQ